MSWFLTAMALLPAGRLTVRADDVAIDPPLEHTDLPTDACESAENTTGDPDEPAWGRPALDLWDGNTSRGPGVGPAAPSAVALTTTGPVICLPFVRVVPASQVAGDPAQSSWWGSVHPHAPPVLS